MSKRNAVYAQSGGVTSVINASAHGMIKAAQAAEFIDEVYAGLDGINLRSLSFLQDTNNPIVPEPATLGLLLIGAAALIVRRRK